MSKHYSKRIIRESQQYCGDVVMDFIGNGGSIVEMICEWEILILYNNCISGITALHADTGAP